MTSLKQRLSSRDATCETVDGLPPEVRGLVHEFGFSVVFAFAMAGVSNPATIRTLIYAVWRGSAEPGNQPVRSIQGHPTLRMLDLQLQAGRITSSVALARFLLAHSYTITPTTATREMVDASIAETGKLGLVDKRTKHHARLTAALRSHAARLTGEPA